MMREENPTSIASTFTSSDKNEATTTKEETPKKSSHWRDAVAGACAGAFSKTAVAPIERVKLLMQLQGSLESSQYKNTNALSVARTVYTEQGLLAFWRGNTPNVLMQAGSAGLNFMLMDWFKVDVVAPILSRTLEWPSHRTDDHRKRRRALWTSFLSGGLAGGTSLTMLYPIAFLRTRLAMDVGKDAATRLYPRGMRDALCMTYTSDGIRGLYQGYGVALVGGIIYRALHLGGYDALKTELLRYKNKHDGKQSPLTWMERFGMAQLVSLTAATVMYPVDSVRRRLMMQAGIPMEERLYRNSFQCVKVVMQREGFRGFYLGLGPNLVRSVGAALLLVAYDYFKSILQL